MPYWSKKITPKILPFQSGGHTRPIFVIPISAKFEKNKKKTKGFSKEFFSEIWLKIVDHKYINMLRYFFSFRWDFMGEPFLSPPPHFNLFQFILISEKTTRPFFVCLCLFVSFSLFRFCFKRSVSMRVTITNNSGQKIYIYLEAIVVKYAKNPGHLSVNPRLTKGVVATPLTVFLR